MSDEKTIEYSDTCLSLYDFAQKLKEKIENYPGGKQGVYAKIKQRFSYYTEPPSQEGIKYSNKTQTIDYDTFRKQVERLDNINLKDKIMELSVKSNIFFLLHIFEILDIKNLSDLMDTTFKEPTTEEYIIETNINVKKINMKLKKISYTLLQAMGRKPRYSIPKVCHDWQIILNDFKNHIEKHDKNYDNQNQNALDKMDIFDPNAWLGIYTYKWESQNLRFGLGFDNILENFKKYFFNDPLLNKYHEWIASMNASDYDPNNKHFILSPLYALYFLVLMNKRFFYYLSLDYYKKWKKNNEKKKNKDNKDKIKFSFVSENGITKDIINLLYEQRQGLSHGNEDFYLKDFPMNANKSFVPTSATGTKPYKLIPNNKPLGKYILERFSYLLNYLKRLINSYMEHNYLIIDGNNFFIENYDICNKIFNIIYDMNLLSTGINEEWLNETITRVNSLNELYNNITLGRANLFFPTDEHINKLNSCIHAIEKKAKSVERENEYRKNNKG